MNIHSIIGLFLAVSVLVIGLFLSTDDLSMFIDYPSMFIVLGGTVAATAVSFQIDRIFILLKVFFYRVIKGKKYNFQNLIKEIMMISESHRKGEPLEALLKKPKDPFFREALEMANDDVLQGEDLVEVLNERIKNLNYQYTEEALKFKSIGKYPPAFGMMGTTIGMIVLLANLGGADALKKIGPAMGLCLITTLYGSAFANLAILPIAENLLESSKETNLKNRIIVEGLQLIVAKTNPIIVAEKLNSYLPPADRLDWKKVLGK